MLHAPLLLFWFSRERVVYCFLVLFALQTIESSEFSTSQKWPPSYHSAQCLMGNTGSLTQPNSMKQLVETGLLCSQTRHFTLTVPLSIRDGRSGGGGDGGWRLVSLELPQFLWKNKDLQHPHPPLQVNSQPPLGKCSAFPVYSSEGLKGNDKFVITWKNVGGECLTGQSRHTVSHPGAGGVVSYIFIPRNYKCAVETGIISWSIICLCSGDVSLIKLGMSEEEYVHFSSEVWMIIWPLEQFSIKCQK